MIKLYLVMGPTGSGKSTAVNYIMKKVPNMEKLIQYTTRPARSNNESENPDYIFVDDDMYDNYMNNSGLVLSNRSYNVPSSTLKVWRYGIIAEDIYKRVSFKHAEDKEWHNTRKPKYDGMFIMAANSSQVMDIICALLSQNGIKCLKDIELNLIYIKTDSLARLNNLYKREKDSSNPNYDELLRRYIDDEEKVGPSCEAVYEIVKSLYDTRNKHDLNIGSVIAVPNDYSDDIFYILDSYIAAYMDKEDK